MLKAIIFDFDGVIVESVNVKTQAFSILFKDYPEYLQDIIKFHIINGGMSRYDKFRYIYKNILKQPLSEEKFNELCQRFSDLVMEQIINSPFVEGAEEFLNKYSGRCKMFVVSGTPDKEIKEIVKRRGLTKYFSGVYGSPASKTFLINEILKENKYLTQEVVFVGDSINDFQAAKATGIFFIARILDQPTQWLNDSNVKATFNNFTNSEAFLEKLHII